MYIQLFDWCVLFLSLFEHLKNLRSLNIEPGKPILGIYQTKYYIFYFRHCFIIYV